MKKYHYKMVRKSFKSNGFSYKLNYQEVEDHINQLGEKGWELVDVSEIHSGGYTIEILLYFRHENIDAMT